MPTSKQKFNAQRGMPTSKQKIDTQKYSPTRNSKPIPRNSIQKDMFENWELDFMFHNTQNWRSIPKSDRGKNNLSCQLKFGFMSATSQNTATSQNCLRGIYFLASILTVDYTLNILEDWILWELIICLLGQSWISRLLISSKGFTMKERYRKQQLY